MLTVKLSRGDNYFPTHRVVHAIAVPQLSLAGRHASRAHQCIPQLGRIPKFPVAARLSSSSIPTALALLSIRGIFFFFFCQLATSNMVPTRQSLHLLCRSSKHCFAERHRHMNVDTLQQLTPHSDFQTLHHVFLILKSSSGSDPAFSTSQKKSYKKTSLNFFKANVAFPKTKFN